MPIAAPADPLSRLVRALDLDERGKDSFVARTGRRAERLFGGLLLAQVAVAAGRTAPGRRLHSLHAYFVRPGRPRIGIEFGVERLRDGRSFDVRRIVGRQSGDATIVALASFTRGGEGIAHQDPMPDAPPPDDLPDWEDLRAAALGDPSKRREDMAIELRVCDPEPKEPDDRAPARRRVWMRPRGMLPDDPLLHTALLLFASDRTLLRVGARPHASTWSALRAASLDHAIWLHRPARFDDWVLFDCTSPAAEEGRPLALGAIYARDGRRLATVAQEGVIHL